MMLDTHVQHVQQAKQRMAKKRWDDAGISQIGLFDVLDTTSVRAEPGTALRSCETCRHWHKNLPVLDRITRKFVESKWHHCSELFVVTKREYGSPIEAGTVLTKVEAQALMLTNIDYLNTAPCFSCDQWETHGEEEQRCERTR